MKILIFTALCFLGFSNLSFANYDIPAICAATTHQDIIKDGKEILGIPEIVLETGAPIEIAKYASDVSKSYLHSWLMQDVTHLNIAFAAFIAQGYYAQDMVKKLAPGQTIRGVLEEAGSKPAHYSSEALAQSEKMMTYFLSQPIDKNLLRIKEAAPALCLPYLDPGCTGAVRETIDMMGSRPIFFVPHWGVYTSLFSVVKRVLEDDGLTQGAAHFALKILDRIKNSNFKNFEAPHLLNEMIASFLATGSTEAQAVDRAWTLIGFYGTRGASMSLMATIANKENMPVYLSLYLFSSVLAVLDHETLSETEPYSYPTVIKTRCAYHAPYHFWLSAYLSRALRLSGHSVKSSVLGPHIMSKLYEFGSSTVGRTPDRPYRDKFMNPYNLMLQMNMAFDDAGSFLGANAAEGNYIDLDGGLNIILKTALPMPELTPAELEVGLKDDLTRFKWFNRVIAPDAWLKTKFTTARDDH